VASYEAKISSVVNEYEEKLANTLIHSNSQNSRLNDELSRTQEERAQYDNSLSSLQSQLDLKTSEVENLNVSLTERENNLLSEVEKYNSLNAEFETFKQQSSLSVSEQ